MALLAGVEIMNGDAFVGRGLGLDQKQAVAAEPMGAELEAVADIDDLTVAAAIGVDHPNLVAGRMAVAAAIEDQRSVRRQFRLYLADALGMGKDLAPAGRDVQTMDSAALGNVVCRVFEIGGIEEMAAVAAERAAEDLVLRLGRRQRPERIGPGTIEQEQAVMLVAAGRLRQHDLAAVMRKASCREVVAAMGDARGRRRTVGRHDPDLAGVG
jgi:hypothetical protein